jgi:acyl-CoA thioester hydrolase
MFKSSLTLRVRYYETDSMGLMHHSNYARYYECARTEAIREIGYPYAQAEKDGTIMPVVKLVSKFLKSLKYDDEVRIETQMPAMPRFGIITFYHQFFNILNELVHEGAVTLAMINTNTNKRENGPEPLIKLMQPYFLKS